MSVPLLKTKLYIPPARPQLVPRPHLIERLNEGIRLGHKLTLISAPAGFGNTTLVSEWATGGDLDACAAWLSADQDDNELAIFGAYLVSALPTVQDGIGADLLATFRAFPPQLPATGGWLVPLINEIADLSTSIVLVLDDYHLVEDLSVHDALAFFVDHLPPIGPSRHVTMAKIRERSLNSPYARSTSCPRAIYGCAAT